MSRSRIVVTTVIKIAVSKFFISHLIRVRGPTVREGRNSLAALPCGRTSDTLCSSQSNCVNNHVNDLYANKWRDQTAKTVDEQVATQEGRGAHRTILDALESQRDQ